MNKKGFSLLETMLYIALLAIVLPGFVLFYVQISERQTAVDEVITTEQKASLTFSKFSYMLTGAQNINVTASTSGVNPSTLIFTNNAGEVVTIDRPTELTSFTHRPDKNIPRLRMQVGASPVEYLTDPEVEVTTWQVDLVRNGANELTGLNFSLELDVNPESSSSAHFEAQTTIDLQPQTTEL